MREEIFAEEIFANQRLKNANFAKKIFANIGPKAQLSSSNDIKNVMIQTKLLIDLQKNSCLFLVHDSIPFIVFDFKVFLRIILNYYVKFFSF